MFSIATYPVCSYGFVNTLHAPIPTLQTREPGGPEALTWSP